MNADLMAMSVQAQRVRRNASPSSTKQVPMRATLPVALMRQGSPNNKSPTHTSPCDGAKSKCSRNSPDNRRFSPERRSSGSPNLKAEKSKTLNLKAHSSPVIRRTASLDTIYLQGQWPRDGFRSYCGTLLVDKSTQTPEEWNEMIEKKKGLTTRSTSMGNGDQLDKFIRVRLQRNKEGSRQAVTSGQRHSPVHGDHSAINTHYVSQSNMSRPVAIPNIPRPLMPRMRNSVEGLNQEIERLVWKGISGYDDDMERIHEPTPDGHRAPIADLFRSTRTVNTQTPSGGGDENYPLNNDKRCHSMSPPIPIILGSMDNPRSSSQIEIIIPTKIVEDFNTSPSPEPDQRLGSSPHNKFLTREPPDGCERVKIMEEPRLISFMPDPLKPRDSFILQPSQGSAFCPLSKGYLSVATQEIAVKLPAAQTKQNVAVIETQ